MQRTRKRTEVTDSDFIPTSSVAPESGPVGIEGTPAAKPVPGVDANSHELTDAAMTFLTNSGRLRERPL